MVDKNINHDPEHEKGAAPPQSMPALFGWITLDHQRERAKELIELSQELTAIGDLDRN